MPLRASSAVYGYSSKQDCSTRSSWPEGRWEGDITDFKKPYWFVKLWVCQSTFWHGPGENERGAKKRRKRGPKMLLRNGGPCCKTWLYQGLRAQLRGLMGLLGKRWAIKSMLRVFTTRVLFTVLFQTCCNIKNLDGHSILIDVHIHTNF